jgi:hypothetical protein
MEALELLKTAAKLDKDHAPLVEEIAARLAAPRSVAPAKTAATAKAAPSCKPTYAFIAANNGSSQPPRSIVAPAAKKTQQAKHVAMKKTDTPKSRRIVMLEATGKGTAPSEVECLSLRNAINTRLGRPVIAEARVSLKGNLTLSPARGENTASIAGTFQQWQDLLGGVFDRPRIPEQWVKLIAHGVPTFLNHAGPLEQVFIDELSLHKLKAVGNPYWLKDPTGKMAGSVVFALDSPADAERALRGLRIGSTFCKVVRKEAFTAKTVCHKCQGTGHNPLTCRASAPSRRL